MARHRRRRDARLAVLLVALLLLSQDAAVQASARHAPGGSGARTAPAAQTGSVTAQGPGIVPTDFSGDVRDLPQVPSAPLLDFEPEEPDFPGGAGPGPTGPGAQPATVPAGPMPAPSQDFAGLSFSDRCPAGTGPRCGFGWPPDTNGDVGTNHYIEAVNTAYAIYAKTGTLLASFSENALFTGSDATPCNGQARGDPIVLYDPLADRWILSHFAFGSTSGPFYQCIAASKTSDPVSGGWWLYALRTDIGGPGAPPVGTLNDYPKFGTWTDCLYFAANGFQDARWFSGSEFASFNRSDLYSGATLRWGIGFLPYPAGDPVFTMIPGNIGGSAARNTPPPGTRDFFVSQMAIGRGYEVREFTPAADCGGGGILGAPTVVSQAEYEAPWWIPQPGTRNMLDSLGDRLMQKAQYRKVGSTESLWAVHTVAPPSAVTVSPQWAQIDVTGGVVGTTPVQEGILSPDTTLNRWMASIAADGDGNAALGYSTSNGVAPNYPSIAYAGRLATDPLGTLPRSEVQLVAGQGSQTNTCNGSPCGRWGDYTSMSVDPVDDCTFWYTNEYYDSPANGAIGNWQTRIGSFRFPTCASVAPATTVQVETAPAGSGTVVPAGSLTAGTSLTAYAVSRDASGGFVANVPASWSYGSSTGGVVAGDLVPSVDSKSAVFTGHLVGTATIHAVSGGLASLDSGILVVVPATATHLAVDVASPQIAGRPFSFIVAAKDAYDNTVPTYGGTARFTSTDGLAILPADHAFGPGDAGRHLFAGGATLVTPGRQTITATDTLTGSITGTSPTIVVLRRPPSPPSPPPAPSTPGPVSLSLTKGVATSQPGPFGSSLTAPEGSTVWYALTLTNTSAIAIAGTTLVDPAAGGTLPAACPPLPSPFSAGGTYACIYSATVAPGTATNTATATAGSLSVTATATVTATPPVLTDAIAPGIERGTTGFTTASVVLPAPGYVTYLVQLAPALAGRHVEVWTRSRTGDWTLTTSRIVAADGTIHYYRRIGAWTGFQAKLAGGASHGRIGTVR